MNVLEKLLLLHYSFASESYNMWITLAIFVLLFLFLNCADLFVEKNAHNYQSYLHQDDTADNSTLPTKILSKSVATISPLNTPNNQRSIHQLQTRNNQGSADIYSSYIDQSSQFDTRMRHPSYSAQSPYFENIYPLPTYSVQSPQFDNRYQRNYQTNQHKYDNQGYSLNTNPYRTNYQYNIPVYKNQQYPIQQQQLSLKDLTNLVATYRNAQLYPTTPKPKTDQTYIKEIENMLHNLNQRNQENHHHQSLSVTKPPTYFHEYFATRKTITTMTTTTTTVSPSLVLELNSQKVLSDFYKLYPKLSKKIVDLDLLNTNSKKNIENIAKLVAPALAKDLPISFF